MGDPRVIQRDNALVRRLNAVAQANIELGTALGGGSGRGSVPSSVPPGAIEGGRATVLPPPARPITAEEALADLPPKDYEQLEAEWLNDPTNPNRLGDAAPKTAPAPETAKQQYDREFPPDHRQSAREFMPRNRGITIDVLGGVVIMDSYVIALQPAETEAVREIAIRAMREETERKIAAMRDVWAPKEEPKVDKPTEAVPPVQPGEGAPGVQETVPNLPAVPVARKKRARRKVSRNVAGKGPKAEVQGGDSA